MKRFNEHAKRIYERITGLGNHDESMHEILFKEPEEGWIHLKYFKPEKKSPNWDILVYKYMDQYRVLTFEKYAFAFWHSDNITNVINYLAKEGVNILERIKFYNELKNGTI
jgi:hypothetical protein